jgi:hypothetical protein
MSTSINIIPNDNVISVQDSNNQITITSNTSNVVVDITQPITNTVQVLTGPQGQKGDQGLAGPSGSSANIDTGSLATTGSNAFNGNQTITGSLNVSGTLNIGGDVGIQTSETIVNTLEEGGVFVNKQTNAFQYSPYNGGPYLNLDIEYQKPLTREIGINTLAIGFADLTVQTTAFVPTTYTTTGSNSFNGNQTITGSLIHGLEGNIATGENSHAEGSITKAIGNYSHAEGDNTQAKGDYSHAEGQETIASGSYSHAEGYQTIALANRQHVQGQWNAASSVESAFIVGNGTDDGNRSNLIHAAGNEVQISGSVGITNLLTLTPQHPLPSQPPTGSFAVSSSVPPRPFFWNGTSWNALY